MSTPVLMRSTRGFTLDAFGPPEVLKLVERETPAPSSGEVLVEVEAAGVNFADTMIRRGEYLRNQPLSLTPGSEVVGRIRAVGRGVDSKVGTRVAGWVEAGGGYAEHVVIPAHRAYPVPDDLPAAAITSVFLQGTAAHYALNRYGRLQSSETVLVHAASGGLGGLAVQLAKAGGAFVVGVASSPEKRDIAREHGADAVVDGRDVDALADRIRVASGGRGADVVVDGVGGPVFGPSLEALAVNGRYVIAGSASQEPARLDARRLLVRNQTICGFILAHIADEDPAEPGRTLLELCDHVRAGTLRPRIEIVPLESAPAVHRRIESRSITGKVVLEVSAR